MISTSPLVSIIIPSFNRAYILNRALESVLNQVYSNWELLIIDDRSSDNTISIIYEYKDNDPRIKYFLNEYPKGPGGARNFGIDHSLGKYIAFLDSDDEWLPCHLSESIAVLETEDVKICSGLWYENKNGVTIKKFSRQEGLDITISHLKPQQKNNYYLFDRSYCEFFLISGFYLFKTSTMVFDKAILKVTGTFDPKLRTNQDVDLFLRMILNFRVCIVNNYHAICYQGNDNLFFFKGSMNIKDKSIVDKLNFHRKYYIKCYLKRKNIIIQSGVFIQKEWALKSTYWIIFDTYVLLTKINKPFNKVKSWYYSIYAKYYSWIYQRYSDKCKGHLLLSFVKRFNKRIDHSTLRKIRRQALLSKLFGSKKEPLFWVYLEDYIYMTVKPNAIFLVNQTNKNKIKFDDVFNTFLKNSIASNQVLIKQSDMLNKNVYNFVRKIHHCNMGGLVSAQEHIGPITFYNSKNPEAVEDVNLLRGMSTVIPELTFYLNDVCENSCKVCKIAANQFVFCRARLTHNQLPINIIKDTISEVMKTNTPVINLSGGDWLGYPDLDDLSRFLILNSIPANYYVHYLNITTIDDIPILQADPFSIKILVHFPVDKEKINNIVMRLSTTKSNCKLIFIVENERNFSESNKLCKKLDDNQWDIIPFYNGQNKGLFTKHVFLTEKDILSSLDITNIDLKGKINITNFGKLFIMPDGNVHTNMNENSIGNINHKPMMEILEGTPVKGSSWYQVRSEVESCKNCVYDVFCPSITNYEFAMQTNKVCTLKNN